MADPYYHTDHHWTTAGAQAAYHIWAEATGHTARSYALVQATDRFRGTLYSKVLLPDSVYDEVDYCPDITIESADCDGTVTDSLYDLAALEKKDKYELFLGGNYAKAVLRTGVENGKHLLLIKDSFANSLVPSCAATTRPSPWWTCGTAARRYSRWPMRPTMCWCCTRSPTLPPTAICSS